MPAALDRWRDQLAQWAIPESVLASAVGNDPWELDPALFRPPRRKAPPGLASRRALDALPAQGTVLDVGCGGGAAALALVPPAGHIIGVDESAPMLREFTEAAASRRSSVPTLEVDTVVGRWPDVGTDVPMADVVVCHHVVYNVAALDEFVAELTDHAHRRVVIELTPAHPQARNAAVWQHFWGIERPSGPTSADALSVLIDYGIAARLEHDDRPNEQRAIPSPEAQAAQVARMCCLGPDRLDEVLAFLAEHPPARTPPDVIWWDLP